jgi:hypothetical protein
MLCTLYVTIPGGIRDMDRVGESVCVNIPEGVIRKIPLLYRH